MEVEKIIERWKEADNYFNLSYSVLKEAYDFFEPFREGDGHDNSPKVFTSAGSDALEISTPMLHGRLFPASQKEPWFKLDIDYGGNTRFDKDALLKREQDWTAKIHKAIQASNCNIQSLPALREAQISMGALQVRMGDIDNPLKFSSSCAFGVRVEKGDGDLIMAKFLEHKLNKRQAKSRWPDAKIGGLEGGERKLHSFCECFMPVDKPRPDGKKFQWVVVSLENKKIVYSVFLRSNPLICFRQDVSSGGVIGRGRAMKALPNLRFLNIQKSDYLRSASVRTLGLMQTDNEQMLGNDKSIEGGEVLVYERGSNGLSPVNLPPPNQLDVQFVQRVEQAVEHIIVGPRLPDAAQGARSDLDLQLRRNEANAAALPSSLRLVAELVVPVVQVAIDILSSPEMAKSPYYLDIPEGIRVIAKSPLIDSQERLEALSRLEAYNVGMSINPEHTRRVVDGDLLLNDYFKTHNIPLKDGDSLKRYDENMAQQQVAALAMAGGQKNG